MKFLHKIVALGLLAATGAQAAPKNIDDCEKIKEPMAYNECLASFGPAAGSHGGGAYLPPAGARHSEPHVGAAGGVIRRGAHGRVHMEFTPGQRRGKRW